MKTKNPKTLGLEALNDKFEDLETEDMGRRLIETDDGAEYLLRQDQRFGHFEFYAAKGGVVPLELRGKFTGTRQANDALTKYKALKSNVGSIAKNYKQKLDDAGFFKE